jgi:hypothetical protein
MTATNLFAYSSSTINAGTGATIQVLDDGVATALSCTVTGNGTTGLTCTSSATVTINPGDFLTVQVVAPPTGTFASAAWRVSFSLH